MITLSSGTRPARVSRGRVRAAIALALVVGLALRAAFAFGFWVGKPLTLDEQEYMLLARSLAEGRGFSYPSAQDRTVRHFGRPPAFPLLLAGVVWLNGRVNAPATDMSREEAGPPASSSAVPVSIKILQLLVGLLCVAFIAACAKQVAGDRAAVAAAGLAAIYPPLTWISGYVLAEPLYCALSVGAVWLLQRGVRDSRPSAPLILAAGVTVGAAALTKEAMLFFVPLAALWLLARRGLRAAIVLCLGVALVLAPWIARNYEVYNRLVVTPHHGGVTFWTGNNALSIGEGDLAANPEMARARVAFETQHATSNAAELDNAYYAAAFDFIRHEPVRWTALVFRKLAFTFLPVGPSYRLHSALYFATSLLSYGLLLCAAIAGIRTLAAARRLADGWALWLLAGSAVIVSVVFFPQERFRIPVIDPTLIVCASAWLAGSLE